MLNIVTTATFREGMKVCVDGKPGVIGEVLDHGFNVDVPIPGLNASVEIFVGFEELLAVFNNDQKA